MGWVLYPWFSPFPDLAQAVCYALRGTSGVESVVYSSLTSPFYQQILQQLATTVAAKYTVDQASWKQAAVDLRQPYWDWAANAVPPPEVISLKKVTITGTNGQKVSVDNPLHHYKFHPIDPSFPPPFRGWQTTLRQPTSDRPNATDNVTRLTA